MQRLLLIIGAVFIVAALMWPLVQKLGLGRLPGDIVIERDNVRFYFPIVTMILISIVCSVILWLIRRFL